MCSHNCPKTGLRLSPLSWTRCGPLTRSPWALQKRMRMRLMGRAPLENLRWRGAGVNRTTEPFVGATERQARRRFARDLLVGAGLSSLGICGQCAKFARRGFSPATTWCTRKYGAMAGPWLQGESHTSIEGLAQDSIRVYIPGLALRRPDKVWLERENWPHRNPSSLQQASPVKI